MRVEWHDDDTAVIEIKRAAEQLGMTFEDTVNFLIGYGLLNAERNGLTGPRATKAMDPRTMIREMAAILGVKL